ncbi:hypothetical protein EC973_009084, partial [Apophysomyces ossiformis]
MVPKLGSVDLDSIGKRWHLSPEGSRHNNEDHEPEIKAISSIRERCIGALYTLEQIVGNKRIKASFCCRYQTSNLVVPKGRPKGALGSRLPSGFEIAEAEKKSDKEVDRDVFILSNKRKSVDQEIDDFPTKRSRAGMPYERVDNADFVVDENIPRDNYINTVDVRGDGYCGFRVLALLLKGDEDEFPSVKEQMLQQLDSNTEIYRNYYNYP